MTKQHGAAAQQTLDRIAERATILKFVPESQWARCRVGLMMLKSDLGVPATVYSDSSEETFQTGPNTQVRTVRKRRREGNATAAGQAGPGRNRYTVNARSAG